MAETDVRLRGPLQQLCSTSDTDVLTWWKQQSRYLPKLATLARQLLAIPAASAASERAFSAAGCTVTARRTALAPETVDNILVVHSNKCN